MVTFFKNYNGICSEWNNFMWWFILSCMFWRQCVYYRVVKHVEISHHISVPSISAEVWVVVMEVFNYIIWNLYEQNALHIFSIYVYQQPLHQKYGLLSISPLLYGTGIGSNYFAFFILTQLMRLGSHCCVSYTITLHHLHLHHFLHPDRDIC